MPKYSSVICAVAYGTRLTEVARRRIARRRVSILVYHDPAPDDFEGHLRFLASRYSFVSLDTVADALEKGTWDDLPDFPLVVTLDDAWRGNAALAPICRRFQCPITIYASSQLLDTGRQYWSTRAPDKEALIRLPNAERIRALVARGADPTVEVGPSERQTLTRDEALQMMDVANFGSHTRFHPWLPSCSDEEAREEIFNSKDELERALEQPCGHFAFPYGAHTVRDRELVAEAGYRTARTIDSGWNCPESDPYHLRAISVRDDAPLSRLAAELAGIGFVWRWRATGRWDGRLPIPAVESESPGAASARPTQ